MKTSFRLMGAVENAASATYAESEFRINDLFDPQGGTGAAQCVGFDQLALLYTRYRVFKSHIEVKMSVNSTSGTPTATALEAQLVVFPSTVVTGAATVADGMSQPFAVSKFAMNNAATIKMSCDIKKFIGNTVNADRLQALVSASPAQALFWHVGVISRAYTNIVTVLQVTVTYEAELFNRALLDRSALDLIRKAFLVHCKQLLNEEKENANSKRTSEQRLMELTDSLEYQRIEKKSVKLS